MDELSFDREVCKHKGWAESYKFLYDVDNKTAKCVHCKEVYKYEEG